MNLFAAAYQRGFFMQERLRGEYEAYVEQAIEDYKDSIPRSEFLGIANAAVSTLTRQAEMTLSESVLLEEVDRQILRRLRLPSYRAWRARNGIVVRNEPVLVGALGEALTPSSPEAAPIIASAAAITSDLIQALSARPELLFDVTPRTFEELVAELLARTGAIVTLTQPTRDGGRDLIAQIRTPFGTMLCLVECKRYAPDRPVGVRPVRELFGVVANERVTQGVLVTTSRFTKAAVTFREKVPHQLSLKAYEDLVGWLKNSAE